MRERAVILATSEDLSEMRDLVSSLGYIATSEEVQLRRRADPRTFLGTGRIETLAEDLEAGRCEADVVVVAGDLEPPQVLRLESQLDRPVYDRIRLILEIFRDRAHNEEAKLQVELARLEYELPLLREAIHQAKTGERPGYQAGGATAFETQVEHLRRRMAKIRDELESLKDDRDVRRKHRRHGGFWQVSLAGYTNAGKSTLLNALTHARVVTEDRLFSTLETRTRRVQEDGGSESRLLITDTVGFIENLPPWLVEAFHATLEEIAYADLVLLVVDASDPLDELDRKVESSLETLRGFLAERDRPDLAENLFLVVNKIDKIDPDRDLEALAARWGFEDRYAAVSARTGAGMEELLACIRAAIPDRHVLEIELPYSPDAYRLLDELDDVGELEEVTEDGSVHARVALSKAQTAKVRARVDELDGNVEEAPSSP